jgi:hypothetical protein
MIVAVYNQAYVRSTAYEPLVERTNTMNFAERFNNTNHEVELERSQISGGDHPIEYKNVYGRNRFHQ